MNELQIFNNPKFGQIRLYTEPDGSTTFCGVDAAVALGYSNTRDAVNRHCKSDGVVFHDVIDSMGRSQKTKFVTEGNLYRLIAGSELPGADEFEHWIFDEVLPSIRKHGGYLMTDKIEERSQLCHAYYPPKSSSAAEVARLLQAVDRPMVAQHSPGRKRAMQAERIMRQFGIDVIDDYVEPAPPEQLTFTQTITTQIETKVQQLPENAG